MGSVTRCFHDGACSAEKRLRKLNQRLQGSKQQLRLNQLKQSAQARIDELAAKANDGLLSEAERLDYEAYIEALDLLGIVKAKARLALAQRGP